MFLTQLQRVPVLTLPGGEPQGVWRLLASNNREIGRSGRAYRSFADAHEHVLGLQTAVDPLTPTVAIDRQHGFSWWVEADGEVAMTAVRWYATASLARESARAAQAALDCAEVAELPLRMTNSGRRTSRTVTRFPGRESW